MTSEDLKKQIIIAGRKAVEQLIKVAKEKIVDSDDDVSADRLKNAAATKKLAIFDAFINCSVPSLDYILFLLLCAHTLP